MVAAPGTARRSHLIECRVRPRRPDGGGADPLLSAINGEGIGIVNIDTGVYGANPEIVPNLVYFYNAVTGQGGGPTTSFDHNGHGTHTAGTEASTNPDIGVATHATLIGVHGQPDPGESVPQNVDPVAAGLQWVINSVENGNPYNIRVVNMSLGVLGTNFNSVPSSPNNEAALIQHLQSQDGVTVVVASGAVTFTATVSPATATGTVTFKEGTTTLGTGTLSAGRTTFSISTLTQGTHTITAVYGGNTTYAGSTSVNLTQTVKKASATTLISSKNPSGSGQSVTFNARVTTGADRHRDVQGRHDDTGHGHAHGRRQGDVRDKCAGSRQTHDHGRLRRQYHLEADPEEPRRGGSA